MDRIDITFGDPLATDEQRDSMRKMCIDLGKTTPYSRENIERAMCQLWEKGPDFILEKMPEIIDIAMLTNASPWAVGVQLEVSSK